VVGYARTARNVADARRQLHSLLANLAPNDPKACERLRDRLLAIVLRRTMCKARADLGNIQAVICGMCGTQAAVRKTLMNPPQLGGPVPTGR